MMHAFNLRFTLKKERGEKEKRINRSSFNEYLKQNEIGCIEFFVTH